MDPLVDNCSRRNLLSSFGYNAQTDKNCGFIEIFCGRGLISSTFVVILIFLSVFFPFFFVSSAPNECEYILLYIIFILYIYYIYMCVYKLYTWASLFASLLSSLLHYALYILLYIIFILLSDVCICACRPTCVCIVLTVTSVCHISWYVNNALGTTSPLGFYKPFLLVFSFYFLLCFSVILIILYIRLPVTYWSCVFI